METEPLSLKVMDRPEVLYLGRHLKFRWSYYYARNMTFENPKDEEWKLTAKLMRRFSYGTWHILDDMGLGPEARMADSLALFDFDSYLEERGR